MPAVGLLDVFPRGGARKGGQVAPGRVGFGDKFSSEGLDDGHGIAEVEGEVCCVGIAIGFFGIVPEAFWEPVPGHGDNGLVRKGFLELAGGLGEVFEGLVNGARGLVDLADVDSEGAADVEPGSREPALRDIAASRENVQVRGTILLELEGSHPFELSEVPSDVLAQKTEALSQPFDELLERQPRTGPDSKCEKALRSTCTGLGVDKGVAVGGTGVTIPAVAISGYKDDVIRVLVLIENHAGTARRKSVGRFSGLSGLASFPGGGKPL